MSYNYAILNRKARCVKLGYSATPGDRLKDLQTASPDQLELIGYWEGQVEDEGALHRKFAAWRQKGEWFELSKPLVIFLREKTLIDLSDMIASSCGVMSFKTTAASFVRQIREDHRLELVQFQAMSTNRDIIEEYELPSQHYWHAYARQVANKYQAPRGMVDRVTGYNSVGDAQTQQNVGYPAWVWIVGWMVHAQKMLNFSYEEAWAVVERQVLQRQTVIEDPTALESADVKKQLHEQVRSLEKKICKLEKRNEGLSKERDSLVQTLKQFQERFVDLRELAQKHYRMDLFDTSLPVVIGHHRQLLKMRTQEVRRLTAAIKSLRNLFERVFGQEQKS